jgi:hypothetical protein
MRSTWITQVWQPASPFQSITTAEAAQKGSAIQRQRVVEAEAAKLVCEQKKADTAHKKAVGKLECNWRLLIIDLPEDTPLAIQLCVIPGTQTLYLNTDSLLISVQNCKTGNFRNYYGRCAYSTQKGLARHSWLHCFCSLVW